jgi:hypothetical protein
MRYLGEVALLLTSAQAPQAVRTLDAMETAEQWKVVKSDGLAAEASTVPGADGKALRLAVDFSGRAGYAAVTRALPITFADNYEISFKLKGTGPANQLQMKLVDASGENVWWWLRPTKAFTADYETVRIKKRHIRFAWGPTKDRGLSRTAAIEFVLNAGKGGQGSFTVDDLTIRPLPPENATLPPPKVSASSGTQAGAALDGNSIRLGVALPPVRSR